MTVLVHILVAVWCGYMAVTSLSWASAVVWVVVAARLAYLAATAAGAPWA